MHHDDRRYHSRHGGIRGRSTEDRERNRGDLHKRVDFHSYGVRVHEYHGDMIHGVGSCSVQAYEYHDVLAHGRFDEQEHDGRLLRHRMEDRWTSVIQGKS